MDHIPEPTDRLIELELERDPWLREQWRDCCELSREHGLDPNRCPAYMISFRDFANRRIEPLLHEAARHQYTAWRGLGEGERVVRGHERAEVAQRVEQRWGPALRLLDEFVSVAEEFGMIHAHRLRRTRDSTGRAYAVLIHLHARGVQVAEEILVLLGSGFAAGAEARWRTLHETALVAAFLSRHGVRVVDKYLEHDHIRVKRAMEGEQEHHQALRLEPYTESEMAEARARYKELQAKYGSAFLGDYGWAAEALGRGPDARSPTFLDIEASLNLGMYRPAYRSASEAVHANLGVIVDNPGQEARASPAFLTRGTSAGFLEPGARTPGSLLVLAEALSRWRPWRFDRIAFAAMQQMAAGVGSLFVECDRLGGQALID